MGLQQSIAELEIAFAPAMELSYEDWENLTRRVARAERNIQFLLGDILNYGDDRFGEQAAQIQDDLGYD